MWTWNSNKVIWHLPNLTCKFISCACNFIPHLHSYKTAYSVCMFSLSLCATLTWLHGFPHWGVWDVKDFPPVGTVSSSAHCVFSLHRHCADSNKEGTDTVSYYVISFSCAFFSQFLVWEVKRRWSCGEAVFCGWTFCRVEPWAAWDHQDQCSKNEGNQTVGHCTYFGSINYSSESEQRCNFMILLHRSNCRFM